MSRLTLRLPETLHHQLEALAQQEKVSLNQYLVYALTRQVASVYEVTAVSPEKVRQQRQQVPPESDLAPELVSPLRYRINEARPEYQTEHTEP